MARDTMHKKMAAAKAAKRTRGGGMSFDPGIGARIKKAREDAGIGVNDLDRLIGAISAVSRWESGERRRIDPRYLIKMAEVLKVTLDWLMGGKGPMRRGSGEFAALRPHLEHVLQTMNVRDRWGPQTIAAARELPGPDRDVIEWPKVLDGIQSALKPFVTKDND